MSSEPHNLQPRSWRIPKVGTLALVAVAILIGALYLSLWVPAQRQAHAVRTVGQFGGYSVYEPGFEVSLFSAGRPDGPEWLWSVVDPNLLYDVVEVRLYANPPSSEDVGRRLFPTLSGLPQLRTLSVSDAHVTNEDLKWIAHLPELRALYLQQTALTEDDLDHLSTLNLDWLCLSRTWAGDEALHSLRNMTTLEYLDLTRTRVTDAGLVHLEGLPNLKTLILRRTRVTDSGAENIAAKLPGCEVQWEPLERR
jgi:hypothetical protein